MTRGEQIFLGGFTGAGIGFAFDIGMIGFPGGVPYATLICMIIGFITAYYDKGSPNVVKKMSSEDYKTIYQKLNKASITKICQSIIPVLNAFVISSLEPPKELLKMTTALNDIQKEEKYGRLPKEKISAVNRSITKFHDDLEFWLPVLLRTINVSADQGLDFGIIGSAADVALYSIMDTMERKNNFNSANRSANERIDNIVRELTTAIQNALQ